MPHTSNFSESIEFVQYTFFFRVTLSIFLWLIAFAFISIFDLLLDIHKPRTITLLAFKIKRQELLPHYLKKNTSHPIPSQVATIHRMDWDKNTSLSLIKANKCYMSLILWRKKLKFLMKVDSNSDKISCKRLRLILSFYFQLLFSFQVCYIFKGSRII